MTPRSQEQSKEIRAEQRERILKAAGELFARRGLAATRISDVAAGAGVSHGLLYHYFGGKDELFTALVERAVRGALWVTGSAREGPGTPWERATRMLDAMLSGMRASPQSSLIVVQAMTSDSVPEGTRRVLERYNPESFANVVELIREGQAAGEMVEGDPGELATSLLSCVQGLAIMVAGAPPGTYAFPEPETVLRMLERREG